MPNRIHACLIAIALLQIMAARADVAPRTLHGTVYLDTNGNGVRDAGERGIAGIAVSNGSAIVRTDTAGKYALDVADGQTVFVVKPAGYALPRGTNGLSVFWRNHVPGGSPALKYGGIKPTGTLPDAVDFALLPKPRISHAVPLEILVFGDPQPKDLVDVDYYRRDIVEPILAKTPHDQPAAQLGLSLGDEVSDDLTLYPAINRVTAMLRTPWLHVAGNHDQDEDAPDDAHATDTFRATFGPTTLAWEESNAEFIVLDDVVFVAGAKPAYIGGLREDQFAFLQAYLPTVPKDRLLVIAVHIPFFDTAAPGLPETFRHADRERLFTLLKDFPHVLLLSAHTHNQRMLLHDASDGWQGAAPLREYNVGTACGAFWSGLKDAAGIPASTMGDGTPNGYATLRVQPGGDYALAWHVARGPTDDPSYNDAMSLEAPKVLRRGAYPAWAVYANVFMGDAGTRVEYRIDGAAWKPMQRVAKPDPRLVAENVADDQADRLRGYDRSPEAVPATHLWRGVLATDLALGTHTVDVRVFDPWQGEEHAQTSYRLDEAAE
jgi:hypothetical protein